MNTIKIQIIGHVNVGKSALATLIQNILLENGISVSVNDDSQEGYDFLDRKIEAIKTKTKVVIETVQANRRDIIE